MSTLVLLHGLGATGAVWTRTAPALAEVWPGPIVMPDLPGHGRAERLPRYSFGSVAAAVAAGLGDAGAGCVVVGHSFGGVIALALASGWFKVDVARAVAVGIKVQWTDDELGRAAALAQRPVARFSTMDEAQARYRRVAGLDAVSDPAAPELAGGVVAVDGGYELAQDPATFGIGVPPMASLLAAARAPVTLACGEHDSMVTVAQLRALDPSAAELAGAGHNVHLDAPELIADLVRAAAP